MEWLKFQFTFSYITFGNLCPILRWCFVGQSVNQSLNLYSRCFTGDLTYVCKRIGTREVMETKVSFTASSIHTRQKSLVIIWLALEPLGCIKCCIIKPFPVIHSSCCLKGSNPVEAWCFACQKYGEIRKGNLIQVYLNIPLNIHACVLPGTAFLSSWVVLYYHQSCICPPVPWAKSVPCPCFSLHFSGQKWPHSGEKCQWVNICTQPTKCLTCTYCCKSDIKVIDCLFWFLDML